MTISIATEKVGARIYVTGNTFAVKDRLKAAGCHWDGERKQWWIGVAKADKISGIVGQLDGAEAPKESLDDRRVYAKVQYKGRTYYVVGESGDRCRLTVLDGSLDFWTDKSACSLLKEYTPREVWDGRRYSGKTVTQYTTLGSLRDFIADCREADKAIAAGEVPDGYAIDHEDGAIKRISECDIPDR